MPDWIDNLNDDQVDKAFGNVENGGYYKVSVGLFSADLDAQSITTFTSYTGNAGKVSNIPPVANAGTDQVLYDNDNNGRETVMLDGSGSSDSDGNIKLLLVIRRQTNCMG